MGFLTLSVCSCFVVLIVYAIVVLVFNFNGIEVSDTLTQYLFTVFGVEFAAAAAIQITKYRIKKNTRDDNVEQLKKNNIPPEKGDVTVTDPGEYDESDYGGFTYG